MNRKEFIDKFVRGGLLAAMTVLAGVLVSRRQVSLEQDCRLELQCGSCNKLKKCQLPEAENERGNEKG